MVRSLRSRAPAPPGSQSATTSPAVDGSSFSGTRSEALRRLQMGAIGVIGVLMLIGLASIIKDRAILTESTAVAGAAPTSAPEATSPAADPLAEAGVVPDLPASPSPGATGGRSAAPPVAPPDAR